MPSVPAAVSIRSARQPARRRKRSLSFLAPVARVAVSRLNVNAPAVRAGWPVGGGWNWDGVAWTALVSPFTGRRVPGLKDGES